MKRIIMFCCLMATFIFLFWNLDSTANAQNLVPNPSFESGTVPTDISTTHYLSQVNKATGWGSPNLASPDLFDSLINTFCEDVNGGSAGVPYNWWNQKVAGTPCPSTTTDYGNTPSYHGSRYAGIIAYFDSSSTPGTDYREYLQVQLSSALVAGNTYNVSFYVRLGNRCKYALQELGAWFSPTQVNIGNFSPILQTEHVVHNSGLLTSINSWQKVSGTYTPSSSGEQYMLIGNFRANSHTTKQTQGGLAALHNSAYYYIDSISVIARDSCDEDTLSLNTGFDHCTGSVYSAPGFDNYWRVIGEPPAATAQFNPSNPPSPTNPRPASVRSAHDAWDGPLSNSQWISSHPVNEVHHNGDYTYRFKFCMEDTSGNPNLWLELLVDDAADVYLNTFPIGSTPANPSGCTSPSIGGCNFRYPTHIISTNDKSLFVSGTTPNILDVVVHNQHGRALGLNIQGYVSGTGVTLEKMECCNDSGAICGYKWFDDNGDGIWQQGTESGIGNWPINLSNGKTVYTDNFGFYFFPNVATGSYQVSEGNPGFGCTQTSTPTIHNVTVSANQIVQNINFGNQCDSVGILCITKFNDTDRDGEKDPGELGIEDWPVSVNGILSTSGFTNSDGQLCVKVIAGTYTVSEFLDEDWLPTTAYTQTVQVNLGQTVEVLFGNFYCPGSDSLILNTGWDQDVGGTFSNAELDNEWYVFSDPDGNTTERRPAYVIPPYYPGNAWANPQTNSKWISSYPTADDDLNGHYVFEYYFCLEDSEDAMLCLNLRADDTASVYLNGNFINSTGTYSFKPYKNPVNMCTANPAFFKAGVNTIRVDVHNTHNVAMGFNLTGYVRGHIPRYWCCCSDSTGGIMGRKFNDLDGDGYWDTGEPTIPNWPIQLSNGQNTTTDIHGNYYFLFLKPGTYTVTEGSISGWV
ncbi:MAG: hypothetical protein HYZ34_06455, partial [Ignavibacteriae bacterium]|nr:hypothetical protein [Ignavibacteriota bacterium]